jgi:hypothetical protein
LIKPEPVKAQVDLKISKAETSSMDGRANSALHLFDSVFDSTTKPLKNQASKQDPTKQLPSKSSTDGVKFNAFDGSEFWSSAGVSKASSNANNKLSKSNVDFTSFDFWSQPQQKSTQEFKTVVI